MFRVKLFVASALISLAAGFAQAQSFEPGQSVVFEGRVSKVLEPGMFVINSGNDKIIVYSTANMARDVESGSFLRVKGQVPKDWMRLGTHEVNAVSVQEIR